MFKKVASDALGLSDLGSVIFPEDYDKTEADDYVMHEDGEKIYFLIKSKSDEYCFTNKAMIHLDGASATSKKRTLNRYNYYSKVVSNVALETAGTIDLDVEIKFNLGSAAFSVDVHKKFIAEVKDLYKTLLKMEEVTKDNQVYLDYSERSLELAAAAVNQSRSTEGSVSQEFNEINQAAFDWLKKQKEAYTMKDYGHIFKLFIDN
ncbi:PH domain-containing protein [Sediminibacillus albus]|uniref:YvbH-like oligomerisation region n=1 Tax=Sediminibacillus albus TaxID=407036 RepID=A0A1G8WZC1_9BACI|nr:PH domain-containing protein [Sediminibacillus albus]SDJ82870.1 YvbH-like oligomerisation region [Sediminibacillus albus]